MLEILFENIKRKVKVESGTNLRKAAIANKISLYPHIFKLLNCRGRGLCTSCRVEIISGKVNERNEIEENNLKKALKTNPDLRLACQITVEDNLVVRSHV